MPVMNGLESAGHIRKQDHPEAESIPIIVNDFLIYIETGNEIYKPGKD